MNRWVVAGLAEQIQMAWHRFGPRGLAGLR
jgi:hypothetical protein